MTKGNLERVARQCHPMVPVFAGISGSNQDNIEHEQRINIFPVRKKPPSKSFRGGFLIIRISLRHSQ
jgi:hypothetical protein